MGFYDLNQQERKNYSQQIKSELHEDLIQHTFTAHLTYMGHEDTYVRKVAYLAIGQLYFTTNAMDAVLHHLNSLKTHEHFSVRQSVINAAGEIGKSHFERVVSFFDIGLFDEHHAPRNAVIGALKKMGEVNPVPVLAWSKKYLLHSHPEIRREVCHGLELRGRKHPEDILPLLQVLEWETIPRVRKTLVHVLGQIAYKKGCLEKVIAHLNTWENQFLVQDAFMEIVDVHSRYAKFSHYSAEQALAYIHKNAPHCETLILQPGQKKHQKNEK